MKENFVYYVIYFVRILKNINNVDYCNGYWVKEVYVKLCKILGKIW